MCYRVWDLRREKIREEHKLELVVTKYLVETQGQDGNESHNMDRELNSFRRMIEAAEKVTESYSNLRTKREEIRRLENTIKTIERVVREWESKFDERVQGLVRELKKPAATDRTALQDAGYICNCNDVTCKFPLVVDDRHYLGFWGDAGQENVVV
ncbi:hypothetical protein KC19_VG291100 [Ceratodon purpureus]|uniref:Uncharacterized protein n=1 Tax=Ceratodon purpureus TaxID=3225 RepID=A0A8T0HVB9_CERPU|nr:hypothetical protein KC19_VG291100 [Ceratodon purpureus]